MESMPTVVVPLFITDTPSETAAADIFVFTFKHPAIVREFQLIVTELVALDMTSNVVGIDLDPSDSARVEKGTFTLVEADAKWKTYSLAAVVGSTWAPFNVKSGDQIIVEQKTAGVDSGTEGGAYIVYMYLGWYPDNVV